MAVAYKLVLLFFSLFVMSRMSKGKCLADALKTVFASKHYHSRWIPDHFVADIICHEYDIPDSKLLEPAEINTALSQNRNMWESFEHQGETLVIQRKIYSLLYLQMEQ